MAALEIRKWLHIIDFGNGMVTAGRDLNQDKFPFLRLPELKNKTLLDVRAVDGFFSFAAMFAGADVTAMDADNWGTLEDKQNHFFNFDFLATFFRMRPIQIFQTLSHYAEHALTQFDVVLSVDDLAHRQDPIQYFNDLYTLTKGVLILECYVDALELRVPAALYYPEDSLNKDYSNYWGMNIYAIEAILKDVGFSKIENFGLWHVNTAHPNNPEPPRSGRIVIHAFK